MAFDPQPHLIQLPRKVKDKATGHYSTVYDDYLEVKWRLCWFRDRYLLRLALFERPARNRASFQAHNH